MSPALLSKRLKELEQAGVIAVTPAAQPGGVEYKLTEAGGDLRGVIMSLGIWGQRWVESSLSLKHLDPAFLMWDSGAISNRGRWPIVDAPWSSSFLRSAAGADTGGSCSTRWISTIGSSVGVASMR